MQVTTKICFKMLAPVLRSQFTTQEVCYAAARVVIMHTEYLGTEQLSAFLKIGHSSPPVFNIFVFSIQLTVNL